MNKANDDNTRNYARYYDSPEGCDIPTKIMVATRYGVLTGLIFSAYDVLMYSHAVGFRCMARRYAYHTIPLGLMGATFATVSNGLLVYRQRDDALNYFVGGMACGPILAAYLGTWHALVLGGMALGVAGMIKKDSIDRCYSIFPEAHPHMRTIWSWRNDFTLVRDPKDDWRHTCEKGQEQK